MSKWAGHFGTLMPFMRAWEKLPPIGRPLPVPKKLPVAEVSPVDR